MAPKIPQRTVLLLAGIIVGLAFSFLRIPERIANSINQKTINERVAHIGKDDYWPARDFSQWNPLPIKESVIDHVEELSYFKNWIEVMNEGVTNRLNMQDVMEAKRGDYTEVYSVFRTKQNIFMDQLSALEPPPRLEQFHRYIMDATEDQIAFYREFAERKASDSSVQLAQMLEHPMLQETNRLLWAAYHEFQRIYPNVDPATNNAIEQRLCWLDMI